MTAKEAHDAMRTATELAEDQRMLEMNNRAAHLSFLTVGELVDIAAVRGIRRRTKMTKNALISNIMQSEGWEIELV